MNRTLRTHSSGAVTMNKVIQLADQNYIHQEEVQYKIRLEHTSVDSMHELMNKVKHVKN